MSPNSLISFVSSRGGNDQDSRDKTRKHRRHSSGERSRREPVFRFYEDEGVIERLCMEVTTALITSPDMRTGKFFATAGETAGELNKSDVTLLSTIAILEHIEGFRAAAKLKKKSTTVEGYYKDMGLENEKLRTMFVMAILTMNPVLVKSIETSLRIALDRQSEKTSAAGDEQKLVTAMTRLSVKGKITNNELDSSTGAGPSVGSVALIDPATSSMLRPPTNSVHPSESASRVLPRKRRFSITSERDLHDFINARKRAPGLNLRFEDRFETDNKPLSVASKMNKYGLGYNPDLDPLARIDAMSDSPPTEAPSVRTVTRATSSKRTVSDPTSGPAAGMQSLMEDMGTIVTGRRRDSEMQGNREGRTNPFDYLERDESIDLPPDTPTDNSEANFNVTEGGNTEDAELDGLLADYL